MSEIDTICIDLKTETCEALLKSDDIFNASCKDNPLYEEWSELIDKMAEAVKVRRSLQ